jgi:hypothetical protein
MHLKKSTTILQITKPNDRYLMNFTGSRTSHSTQRISQSHSLVMSANRFNPSAISTSRKKPFLQHTLRCSHPDCTNKSYKSINGLHTHLGKSPQCASFRMSVHNRQAQAELQPPPLEHLEALTEYPWDDEELHEAVSLNSIDDNSASGTPNNQAGIYSESANDAALKFGIRFNTYRTILILTLITKCSGEVS